MSEKVSITVKEGRIRGIKKKSAWSGAEYYSFYGIPYGQSTAGQARFKDPVKVKPWKTVLDCTTEKEGCSQYSVRLERFAGSEDCLYNNIHTPKLPAVGDPLKPVIVMIHPGGFFHGSPETFYYGSPEYLMHKEIVYVGIAYRIHILGFLNLALEECSGNQGVKDVLLGLQWMKENIDSFGGDPNNITILGSSSGSGMVNSILQAPPSRGLFHKAVVMGTYCFNPTLVTQKENASTAFRIAKKLGYEGDINERKKLLAFLKKSDILKFILMRSETENSKKVVSLFPCSPFVPIGDRSKTAVLPLPPKQSLSMTHRVPLLVGICEKEGAMGFSRIYKKASMENFYTSFRQNYAGWGADITDEQVKQIKKEVEAFYFNGGTIENASLSLLIDVQSDIACSGIYNSLIDIVAADLPESVFVYKFEFEGNVCTIRDRIQQLLEEPVEGTFHATDFSYFAEVKDLWGGVTATPTPRTKQMIEKFTNIVCTFARTGTPNYEGIEEEWKPHNLEHPCYMSINDKLQMVDGKLNGARMEFWENIVKKYGGYKEYHNM